MRGIVPLLGVGAAAVSTSLVICKMLDSNPTEASTPYHSPCVTLLNFTVDRLSDSVEQIHSITDQLASGDSSPSVHLLSASPNIFSSPASSPLLDNLISPAAAASSSSGASYRQHKSSPSSSSSYGGSNTTKPVDIARDNPKDVAQLRHHAQQLYNDQPLPQPRFTDAELIRYAITFGYTPTASPEKKAYAIEQGAAAAVRTANWLEHHPFATAEDIKRYSHLIHWGKPDADGHPTLYIAIGAAAHQCKPGPEALLFSNIIITHVEQAMREMLDDTGGPQKVNVFMDASGTTALRASRFTWLFKAVSSTLNHHYPGRLNELVLANLPVVLTWLVAGVKKLLHPNTRDRVRVVRGKD